MADEQGFYRSDGIQNSGTGIKQNGDNTDIYNSAKKIYPRIVTETDVTFDNGSPSKGYDCQTCRSGFNNSGELGTWAMGKASQGYYNGSEGAVKESCGHFFSQNGRKVNVGQGDIKDYKVTYVRIEMHRMKGGAHSELPNGGHLRYSNLEDSYKNGEFRGARFSDIDFNLVLSDDYVFDIPTLNDTVVLVGNGENNSLCKFIKRFMDNDDAKSLALYNGETYNNAGEYSTHYCSFDTFSMEVRGERTIQL